MTHTSNTYAAARNWLNAAGIKLTARHNDSIHACPKKRTEYAICFRCPAKFDVPQAQKLVEQNLGIAVAKWTEFAHLSGKIVMVRLNRAGTRLIRFNVTPTYVEVALLDTSYRAIRKGKSRGKTGR